MEFRRISNPTRVSPDRLKELCQTRRPGSILAQEKWDGWRRPMIKENGVWRFANKGADQARKEMPEDLIKELAGLFADVDNIGLDTEWVGPRNHDAIAAILGAGYNGLVLHDLHWANGLWVGNQGAKPRFSNLATIFSLAQAAHPSPRIQLVRCVESGWEELFEESKRNPLLEGVVLKDAASGLGHPWLKSDGDNVGWSKVKWRDIHEAASL